MMKMKVLPLNLLRKLFQLLGRSRECVSVINYTPASPDYSPAFEKKSDLSEDPSSDHVPPLPAILPFYHWLMTPQTRSPVIPHRRVMILALGQPIHHGQPYHYHLNGLKIQLEIPSMFQFHHHRHTSDIHSDNEPHLILRSRHLITIILPPNEFTEYYWRGPSARDVGPHDICEDVRVGSSEETSFDWNDVNSQLALRDRWIDARVVYEAVESRGEIERAYAYDGAVRLRKNIGDLVQKGSIIIQRLSLSIVYNVIEGSSEGRQGH
ncbi:hypothetical protein Tco_1162300 [Tanacetum coccineum]